MTNNMPHINNRLLRFSVQALIIILSAIVSLLSMVLIAGAFADYRPARLEPVTPKIPNKNGNNNEKNENNEKILSFLIWNIGYAGLGKESDLFHDGGKMVHTPKKVVQKNVEGIKDLLIKMQNVDFFMLQEVDQNSHRSYFINQADYFSQHLPDYTLAFATNYNAAFIPYPVKQPYGKVWSGLATYSRFTPKESLRYALPAEYPWPVSMFFVKRCFLVQRYEVTGNKELVLINTHKSAYDSDGKVKKTQMQELKSIILKEYEKGNYVVVGGDWNQSPPGYKNKNIAPQDPAFDVPNDFMPPGWQWIYDPTHPSNRKMHTVYQPGETPTQLLDFFLISPNLELIAASTIDQQFEFSDHHPVYMRVQLK